MKIKNWRSVERPAYYVLNPENETVKETISWIKENPKSWNTIKKIAIDKAINSKSKISSFHLISVARWDMEHIKIANAYSPVIARILEYTVPSLKNRFTKAKSNTEMLVTTKLEEELNKNKIRKMVA